MLKPFLLLPFLALLHFWTSPSVEKQTNPVVMELFTSEGCSSCPPADQLLSDYASADEHQVIALSFHVHYWDRLGWSDPYSHQKYTDRQRDYAQKLNVKKIYTPQMVINGVHTFIGSDKEKARETLEMMADKPMPVEISITEIKIDGAYCSFNYRLSSSTKGLLVNFAFTEDGLSQQVLRGENRGKLLKHDNVVRAFKSEEAPKKSGEILMRLPDEAQHTRMKVVVYAQQLSDYKVVGATTQPLLP